MIEDANKKAEFPKTFVYSKLIEIIKENFKEFFVDPNDLLPHNNSQTGRRKGRKFTLSQGIYEYGDDFFDLKFDGKQNGRTSFVLKDKKNRVPLSNINKSNHFWWLISKAYLNKFLLEDAKDSLNKFISQAAEGGQAEKITGEDKQIEPLFAKD